MAMDLVETRLRNGTASSQETTHFLKLGSMKERKELELLEKQKQLMTAKTEALQSAKQIEKLYGDAMKAFSVYSGNRRRGEEDDDY
jgi:regulator of replication initiation timing